MKVFVEHSMNQSGKGKFLNRLMYKMEDLGVSFSNTDKRADLCLCLTRFRSDFKGLRVLRVDGVLFSDDKRSTWNNGRVNKCINKADAVIWQSSFCHKMGHGILKVRAKREFVIPNGDYEDKVDLTFPGKNRVIASANWGERTHKRLNEMNEIMHEYINRNPDTEFHVMGESKILKTAYSNIKYYGKVNEPFLKQKIRECNIMLNLAWFDWAPNSVVECLVAGLPVVYCQGTGMQDLVGDSGVMVKDSSPKPKYLHVKHKGKKRYRPKVPPIDYEEVMVAIDKALKMPRINRPDLFIENVALKYKTVFDEVLNS